LKIRLTWQNRDGLCPCKCPIPNAENSRWSVKYGEIRRKCGKSMEVHGDNNQPFIDVSVGWANQIAVSVSKCVGIQHDTATI